MSSFKQSASGNLDVAEGYNFVYMGKKEEYYRLCKSDTLYGLLHLQRLINSSEIIFAFEIDVHYDQIGQTAWADP